MIEEARASGASALSILGDAREEAVAIAPDPGLDDLDAEETKELIASVNYILNPVVRKAEGDETNKDVSQVNRNNDGELSLGNIFGEVEQ